MTSRLVLLSLLFVVCGILGTCVPVLGLESEQSERFIFCRFCDDGPMPRVERLDGPAITPDMLPSPEGDNINFPTIVFVPHGVPNRLANYYMYFSSHKGDYIRLAYANSIQGPWTIYANGTDVTLARFAELNSDTTDEKSHVASPEVRINEDPVTRKPRFEMIFHFRMLALGHQSAYAYSTNGISWTVLPGSYFPDAYARNIILPDGSEYLLSRHAHIYRVLEKDPVSGAATSYEYVSSLLDNVLAVVTNASNQASNTRNNGRLRHVGVDYYPTPYDPTHIFIYTTRISDAPERIVATRLDITCSNIAARRCIMDASKWKAIEAFDVLRAERDYEGGHLPVEPSSSGDGPADPVNQLRDPSPFFDPMTRRHYLAYSIAGELGIAIAEVTYS